MRNNSLRRVARIFNKSQDYFSVMKSQNRERFEFISSFDKDNFRKSVYKYIDYVVDLFFEAQEIYPQLNKEQLDSILLELGYNNQSPYQGVRKQVFQDRINMLVTDEDALSIYFGTVKKLQQFIKISKEIK
jgi:hypothetical protein